MKRAWRTVRAVVEVKVTSPDFAPYTDRDLRNDLLHLVGGGQLNMKNAKIGYKLYFGAVQVKSATMAVAAIQRGLAKKAKERAMSAALRYSVPENGREAFLRGWDLQACPSSTVGGRRKWVNEWEDANKEAFHDGKGFGR